ncbi:MAG: hypothetical protein HJJLKODD_01475 [Phycisphaerae bacterium]|nr:hypothetical protein [Phycisphaerae bacterium]
MSEEISSHAPRSAPPSGETAACASLGRRVVGWLALILLMLIGLSYFYLTRPQRLIGFAEQYLQELTGGQVHIAEASFSLFEGLQLGNVSIQQPPSIQNLTLPDHQHITEVFQCRSLQFIHDPMSLLMGRLQISEIRADHAHLHLVWNPATNEINLTELLQHRQLLSGPIEAGMAGELWPQIIMRDLQFSFYRQVGAGLQFVEDARLDLYAAQRRSATPVYQISWQELQAPGAQGRVKLDLLSGNLEFEPGSEPPWLPVEFVVAALPPTTPQVDQWISLLNLDGDFRIENLSIGKQAGPLGATGKIVLRQASLSIPMDLQEESQPPEQRFFFFDQVSGFIEITNQQLQARFQGQLRGRYCSAELKILNMPTTDQMLSASAWELAVKCDDFLLLRPDPVHYPQEQRVIERWPALRNFYKEFQPSGRVRLNLDVVKAAGTEANPELALARFDILEATLCYFRFPYRANDVTGTIVMDRTGRCDLIDVVGRHGTARIAASGMIEAINDYSGVDLKFETRNVPLDEDLRAALPEDYQQIWELFALQGMAHMQVHIFRPNHLGRPYPDFEARISAELLDGQATFVDFPYPITGLHGRININDAIEVKELQGRCGTGTVVFNGFGGQAREQLNLDIRWTATDLPLDQMLFEAIPTDERQLLEPFTLSGKLDLQGRVFRPVEESSARYELEAELKDARLRYHLFPYPLQNCSARLRITPEQFLMRNFLGHQNRTAVTASADINLDRQPPSVSVDLQTQGLTLDETLRKALPENLQRLQQQFDPQGEVDLQLQYRQPATSPDEELKVIITARENDLHIPGFTGRLNNVRGQIIATPQKTEMIGLQADFGEAELEMSGHIDLAAGEISRGQLRLYGWNWEAGRSLRDALPRDWQNLWDTIDPEGLFNFRLPELAFERAGPGQPLQWRLRGQFSPDDMSLHTGIDINQLFGDIDFTAETNPLTDELLLRGQLQIDAVTLFENQLQKLTGQLIYDQAQGLLALRQLQADLYNGQVRGTILIDQLPDQPQYDAIIHLRGARLQPMIADWQQQSETPTTEDDFGLVSAILALRGDAADPETRRGWGTMRIDRAALYQLPLLLAILNVINLAQLEEGAFQQVECSYSLEGGQILINDLLLNGQAISLRGTGSLTWPEKELRLKMVAVGPENGFRLPVLTHIVEEAASELFEVEVGGTLDEPQIKARPLRTLNRTLHALFENPPEE